MDEENGEELRSQFHAVLALAFDRPDFVIDALDALRQNADQLLGEVLTLLEDYYVLGRRIGRGRGAVAFPVETWNVYHRTLNEEARTNNSCEGWNNR